MSRLVQHLFTKSFALLATVALFAVTSGPSRGQDAGEIDMKMANLASQLSSRISGTAGWRIAVVPFVTGSGLSSELSEYMVRSLCTQLIN